jgi:hypothetical protein
MQQKGQITKHEWVHTSAICLYECKHCHSKLCITITAPIILGNKKCITRKKPEHEK